VISAFFLGLQPSTQDTYLLSLNLLKAVDKNFDSDTIGNYVIKVTDSDKIDFDVKILL